MKFNMKLLFLLTFTCLSYSIDKSLKFNSPRVLDHIINFQVINEMGNDKVFGYHYYQPNSIESKKNIKICKINANLWIATADNHESYHEGYIIYNGQWIDQKSFFPCNWSKEQLKAALSTIEHERVIEINNNEFEYELEEQTLKIVLSNYARIKKSFIKTIFPIIDRFTVIDRNDLEDIAKEQKKQIINIPQQISNFKDIKLSDIEDAVSKSKIEKIYELLECANNTDIDAISQEILTQSISHYKSDYFVFALDLGAQVTPANLIKLVSKSIDDFSRAKMLSCLLEINKSITIDTNILKLALKAKSPQILEVLIRNFAYWNKLTTIPGDIKKDPIANPIITKYEAEAKNYSDPLLHSVFYNNEILVKELCLNATETKLNQALEIAQENIELIIQEELEKRQNIETAKKEALKKQKKEEEKKAFNKFIDIFKAALNNTNPYIEFTTEEIEIIKPFKNKVLNERNETPLLICAWHDKYNNPEDYSKRHSGGKVNLVKQLLELGADIGHTNSDNKDVLALAFEHDNFKIMDYLLNENTSQAMKFICNWWSKNLKYKDTDKLLYSEFIRYQYPREIFIPWFSEIIKFKNYDLNAFKETIKSLTYEILIDVNKLLKVAAKADRKDIAEELINLEADNIEEALEFAPKESVTFELLNNIVKAKEAAQQDKLREEQEKLSKEEQEKADKLAQDNKWTPLIRALLENKPDAELIALINDDETDLKSTDINGHDAYYYAQEKNRKNIAEKIYYKINSANWTDYEKAAYKNDKDKFTKLIRKNQPIIIFRAEITPDLKNIDLYMNLCNPKSSTNDKIDLAISIMTIKTLNTDLQINTDLYEELMIVYQQLLSEKAISEEQKILISFNIALINCKQDFTKNHSIKVFQEIINHKNPYAKQFKIASKLHLIDLYEQADDYDLIETTAQEILSDELTTQEQNIVAKSILAEIYYSKKDDKNTAQKLFEEVLIPFNARHLTQQQIGANKYYLATIYNFKQINPEAVITLLEDSIENEETSVTIKEQAILKLDELYMSDKDKLLKLYTNILHKYNFLSAIFKHEFLKAIMGIYQNKNDHQSLYKYVHKFIKSKLTNDKDRWDSHRILGGICFQLKKLEEACNSLTIYLTEAEKHNATPDYLMDVQILLANIYAGCVYNLNEPSVNNIEKAFDLCIEYLSMEVKLNHQPSTGRTKLKKETLLKILSSNISSEKHSAYIKELSKPEYAQYIPEEVKKQLTPRLMLQEVNLDDSSTAQSHFDMAQRCSLKKDFKNAIHHLNECLKYEQTNKALCLTAQCNLAHLYYVSEEFDSSFLKCIDILSNNELENQQIITSNIHNLLEQIINKENDHSNFINYLNKLCDDKFIKERNQIVAKLNALTTCTKNLQVRREILTILAFIINKDNLKQLLSRLNFLDDQFLLTPNSERLIVIMLSNLVSEIAPSDIGNLEKICAIILSNNISEALREFIIKLIKNSSLADINITRHIHQQLRLFLQARHKNEIEPAKKYLEDVLQIKSENFRINRNLLTVKTELADICTTNDHLRAFILCCEVLQDDLVAENDKSRVHGCILKIFEYLGNLTFNLNVENLNIWVSLLSYSEAILDNGYFSADTKKFIIAFLEKTIKEHPHIPDNNIRATIHHRLAASYRTSNDDKMHKHYTLFLSLVCTNPDLIKAQEYLRAKFKNKQMALPESKDE
ncbi:MAG: hypothetical protein P4L22_03110 [Candidatus Babeliales bacterium]|nr:hypothetical protein [Candidatus Babeliales bacterium]